VLGADGAAAGGAVTGVAAGTSTSSPVAGGVGTNIAGAYGTLHLNADGSYSYTANPNSVTSNQVDHFVYTITDGDGDKSTTTLDITVNNVTLAADNQTKTVNEAALSTGSNPSSTAETATGQLAVSGATGYTAETIVGTHGTLTLNANGTFTFASDGSVTTPVTFNYWANNAASGDPNLCAQVTLSPG